VTVRKRKRRKEEIGRDDVLMRHSTRILLKRIRTKTGWKCQEIWTSLMTMPKLLLLTTIEDVEAEIVLEEILKALLVLLTIKDVLTTIKDVEVEIAL
jgi:hypothetical protein